MMKFEKGKTYNTLKTLGVVKKDGGFLQISQKTGRDAADITPQENLTFDCRENGRLYFIRSDGTRVVGHATHFDPENAYNKKLTADEKLENAKKKLALKQTNSSLDETAKQLEDALNVAESVTSSLEDVPDDIREEAEALFAEN